MKSVSKIKNIAETGHAAGVSGAISGGTALTISTITNLTNVISGKKDVDETLSNIAKDGTRAAASGYVMSGGLTLAAQGLSKL